MNINKYKEKLLKEKEKLTGLIILVKDILQVNYQAMIIIQQI